MGGSDGGSDLMREVAARRSDPMVLLSLLSCLVVLGMGPGCLKNHQTHCEGTGVFEEFHQGQRYSRTHAPPPSISLIDVRTQPTSPRAAQNIIHTSWTR